MLRTEIIITEDVELTTEKLEEISKELTLRNVIS